MDDQEPRHAARVHEQAHAAVEAARAARERSRQVASEIRLRLRRCRGWSGRLDLDAATEAVLRANLERTPPERPAPDLRSDPCNAASPTPCGPPSA